MARASDTTFHDPRLRRKKGSPRRTVNANADLRRLLFELARALLPRGITPTGFSILAREAFTLAAAGHARMRSGKVNHSKVAALTGLPRKEIGRILKSSTTTEPGPGTATSMPFEKVVRGWLTDRRFLTRRGRPKSLAVCAAAHSFDRLVKIYAGDVSPRAVLEQLLRSRIVRRSGERLVLQASRSGGARGDLGCLSRAIPTIVDVLRIASSQPASGIDSVLCRVDLRAASEAELTLIRQRCSSAVQSLLHGLKESLEHEFTVPRRRRSSAHSLTVTALLADRGPSES